MPFSSFRKIEWWVIVLACVFVFASWAQYRAYRDADREVFRTIEVRRQLILLGRDLQAAQRGQRGYLATGKQVYLDPYRRAVSSFPPRLTRTRELVNYNPRQLSRLDRVKESSDMLFAELERTINYMDKGYKDEAFRVVDTGQGEALITAALLDLDDCTSEEDRQLMGRREEETLAFRACLTASVVAAASMATAFVFAFRRRLFRRQ